LHIFRILYLNDLYSGNFNYLPFLYQTKGVFKHLQFHKFCAFAFDIFPHSMELPPSEGDS